MNNERWRTTKPSELATPGLVATILIVSFLLVLFATESGRQPGAQQLPVQAELFGIYHADMLVGWGSVSKPRRERTPHGAIDIVSCATNFRFLTQTGSPRYYETETAYEVPTAKPLHFTGRFYTRRSPTQEQVKVWECFVRQSEIIWQERGDQWQVVAERNFDTQGMSVFLLHKYSMGSWEYLLRRLDRTEDGLVPAEVSVFDVESCALSRIVCSQMESVYADVGNGKDFYWLVQFGPNAIGYVHPLTLRLDQLIFTRDRLTLRREDVGLFEQFPTEPSYY